MAYIGYFIFVIICMMVTMTITINELRIFDYYKLRNKYEKLLDEHLAFIEYAEQHWTISADMIEEEREKVIKLDYEEEEVKAS